jgi:nucleoside-diphosphate-sugar epimerase
MNIALLGDAGFVGRNVAEVLTENGLTFIGTSLRQGTDRVRVTFLREK